MAEGLRVRGLRKAYRRRGTWSRAARPVQALDGVDLDVARGRTVALVGSSGAGKSTLARCLASIERPDAGELSLDGEDLLSRPARGTARRIQMLFQDVAHSLNPRLEVADIVSEPLLVAGRPAGERAARAGALMERVGLSWSSARRRPLELSGGQRQRVAIARALAADPRLLIVDEALSGLDRPLQAQVLNLLRELEQSLGLQCLHVSHDLPLMAAVADELAVVAGGRIVEHGPTAQIISQPNHPETIALVAHLP